MGFGSSASSALALARAGLGLAVLRAGDELEKPMGRPHVQVPWIEGYLDNRCIQMASGGHLTKLR